MNSKFVYTLAFGLMSIPYAHALDPRCKGVASSVPSSAGAPIFEEKLADGLRPSAIIKARGDTPDLAVWQLMDNTEKPSPVIRRVDNNGVITTETVPMPDRYIRGGNYFTYVKLPVTIAPVTLYPATYEVKDPTSTRPDQMTEITCGYWAMTVVSTVNPVVPAKATAANNDGSIRKQLETTASLEGISAKIELRNDGEEGSDSTEGGTASNSAR